MQYVFRSRRIFACAASGHLLGTIAWFSTWPQLGQQRTLTTMRP
jgi:hypothetical protein